METLYRIEDGITESMITLSRLNEGNKVRLAGKFQKAKSGEELTVAYIGGSITQGSDAGAEDCYARLTANWFVNSFPNTKVNYVNAGIGATGSYFAVHRVDEDVLFHKPDIVFIDFSVNDTTEHTERNKNAYDSLLRKLWFGDKNPAVITIAMTMEDGTSFQDYHSEIVKAYDIPMISYKNAILDVINKGYIKWKDISNDDIHPNKAGHLVLSQIIISYLEEVLENADNIGGSESDLSKPYTSDKYAHARVLRPTNAEIKSYGIFSADKEQIFGNYRGFWQAGMEGDAVAKESALVFKVAAKNIGLFYGKLLNDGAGYEIFVDGKLGAVASGDFSEGWGEYAEALEVYSSDTVKEHVVEIVPMGKEAKLSSKYILSALAVS